MDESKFEQILFQILSSKGCMIHQELLTILQETKRHYCENNNVDFENLHLLFQKFNKKLRMLNFEIKTVVFRNSQNQTQQYHGLVNLEDDFVSKEYGSPFSPHETKFFVEIISLLISQDKISSAEAMEIKPEKWTNADVNSFLSKLTHENWLLFDERSYIVIGPRTQLELRSLIENTINEVIDNNSSLSEQEKTNEIEDRLKKLPQIILY